MIPLKVAMKITGMHCRDCAVKVEDALRSVKETKQAKVSYLKKEATVELQDGCDAEALREAVREAGYHAEIQE